MDRTKKEVIKISKLKYFNGKEYVEPKMKIFDNSKNEWIDIRGKVRASMTFGTDNLALLKAFSLNYDKFEMKTFKCSYVNKMSELIPNGREDVFMVVRDNGDVHFDGDLQEIYSNRAKIDYISIDEPLYYSNNDKSRPVYHSRNDAQYFLSNKGDIIYCVNFNNGIRNRKSETRSVFVKAIKKSNGEKLWHKTFYLKDFVKNFFNFFDFINRKSQPILTVDEDDNLRIAFKTRGSFTPFDSIKINKNGVLYDYKRIDRATSLDRAKFGGLYFNGKIYFEKYIYQNDKLIKDNYNGYTNLDCKWENESRSVRIPIFKTNYIFNPSSHAILFDSGNEIQFKFPYQYVNDNICCMIQKEDSKNIEITANDNSKRKYTFKKDDGCLVNYSEHKPKNLDYYKYKECSFYYDLGNYGIGQLYFNGMKKTSIAVVLKDEESLWEN